MPKVVIHTPEPGSSAARYVFELLNALCEEGVAVHFICPVNHEALSKLAGNPQIEVHPTALRSTCHSRGKLTKLRDNLRFVLSSSAVLWKTVRRRDLVHFQYGFHIPFEMFFFASAWLRGCVIVFTAHDPLPHKWSMPSFLRWIEMGALRWMYRVSDIIMVHSEAGKRTIHEHFSEANEKVHVIAHGPYPLNTALSNPRSNRLELLFFGALRENKGPHLAIQAVQRLYRTGVPLRLTVAGRVLNEKERDYWERCRATIAAMPEPIRLIEEFVPEDKLPELFSGCHCLLLPYGAFYSDSGVAYLALANGKPLLATAAGGLGELLEASKGGILIDEATVNAVEVAIRKAAELGPDRLERMGREGTAWVLQECGWPKVAGQTMKLYESALGMRLGALALTVEQKI